MPIPSDTIALPITKGLDATTDARLVNPPSLLEAENTQFAGGGAKKRRGHTSLLVRGEGEVLPEQSETTWIFGAGLLDANSYTRPSGEYDTSYWCSANPGAGKIHGVLARDNETVAWDGFRFFSYLPSQLTSQTQPAAEVEGEAILPSLTATAIAKYNENQKKCELADTGEVKLVAWVNEDSEARYAIYDSTTGSLIAQGTLAVTTASFLRVFSLGVWLHVMVLDADDNKCKLFSINSSEPNDITFRSYGDATHFDLWKVSDTEVVLARVDAGVLRVSWISTLGSGSPTRTPFAYTPGVATTPELVSIAHSRSEDIGLAWVSGNDIGVAVFDTTMLLEESLLASDYYGDTTDSLRISIAPHYTLTDGNMSTIWEVFADNGSTIKATRVWIDSGAIVLGTTRTRYNLILASRAFRVGDRVFFWGASTSALQSTWFLLDEEIKPVGHMDFGVADSAGYTGYLTGINFSGTEGYEGYEFHCALSYKLRVAPKDSALATSGIYTEASPKAVYLDFLPSLSVAQAGRASYIAGAQLWSYDGQEVTEAGFHLGPEPELAQSPGGALTSEGTYSYRVDLCYRNAQNEEIRSLSLLTESLVLTPGNQTITLTIPTVLTRRENAYFLIYRNAMSSGTPLTTWWLLNSRDPANADYLTNNLGVNQVIFTDDGDVDDTEIQTRELHPATDTYLQPIAAPACTVITSGRDRLWLAGGELAPGVVAPSRLFDPGEIPSFNAYLNIQVDRSVQPITALGFTGEVAVIFRESATHLLDSDGPDNVANGLWNPPRLAHSDVGAVSQASVARISAGLLFQSRAGVRLIQPGGSLLPGGNLQYFGQEVDEALRDFEVVGTLVNEADQEVRFYGASGVYVFNYLYGTWARWTCGGVGVAKSASGAILAREDGHLWIETPGVWKDGDATYTHRIRTSWLHAGNLGDFQRVRWVGGLGRFADLDSPAHTLRLEIFYDEREFWEERIEWEPLDTANSDTWGSATWGAGIWGDTGATIENLDDLTWEWERRPSRQKCSVFSVALEDVNTDGPGFELSAFTFSLARKSGLDRTADRGGTGTYRSNRS